MALYRVRDHRLSGFFEELDKAQKEVELIKARLMSEWDKANVGENLFIEIKFDVLYKRITEKKNEIPFIQLR